MECRNCSNSSWWRLVTERTWFTFFFVPVVPYRTRRMLLCEVCERGFELDPERFEKTRRMARVTGELANKKLAEAEYLRKMREIMK